MSTRTFTLEAILRAWAEWMGKGHESWASFEAALLAAKPQAQRRTALCDCPHGEGPVGHCEQCGGALCSYVPLAAKPEAKTCDHIGCRVMTRGADGATSWEPSRGCKLTASTATASAEAPVCRPWCGTCYGSDKVPYRLDDDDRQRVWFDDAESFKAPGMGEIARCSPACRRPAAKEASTDQPAQPGLPLRTMVAGGVATTETHDDRLAEEIEHVINRHSRENASGTPDFILSEYLMGCLAVYERTIGRREDWHGRPVNTCATPAPSPESPTGGGTKCPVWCSVDQPCAHCRTYKPAPKAPDQPPARQPGPVITTPMGLVSRHLGWTSATTKPFGCWVRRAGEEPWVALDEKSIDRPDLRGDWDAGRLEMIEFVKPDQPPAPTGFRVRMICCEKEHGHMDFTSWEKADQFRNDYISGRGVNEPDGSGHRRSAIIEPLPVVQPAPAGQPGYCAECGCEMALTPDGMDCPGARFHAIVPVEHPAQQPGVPAGWTPARTHTVIPSAIVPVEPSRAGMPFLAPMRDGACKGCGRLRDVSVGQDGFCEDCRSTRNRILYSQGHPCRGCGLLLAIENFRIADGCPCNGPRGLNHGIVPVLTCTCVECDPAQTGSTRAPEPSRPGTGEAVDMGLGYPVGTRVLFSKGPPDDTSSIAPPAPGKPACDSCGGTGRVNVGQPVSGTQYTERCAACAYEANPCNCSLQYGKHRPLCPYVPGKPGCEFSVEEECFAPLGCGAAEACSRERTCAWKTIEDNAGQPDEAPLSVRLRGFPGRIAEEAAKEVADLEAKLAEESAVAKHGQEGWDLANRRTRQWKEAESQLAARTAELESLRADLARVTADADNYRAALEQSASEHFVAFQEAESLRAAAAAQVARIAELEASRERLTNGIETFLRDSGAPAPKATP